MDGTHLNAPITALIPTGRRQGLLAVRGRRRRVHVRQRALLRLDGRHAARRAGRRHGVDADRQGLLARRGRRRHLQLRRRGVPRLDGRQAHERAGRRHGARRHRQGLLARGRRRRGLHLRRRAVRRAARRARCRRTGTSRSSSGCRAATATACSPSPTPPDVAIQGPGATGAEGRRRSSSACIALGFWLPGVDRRVRLAHPAGGVRVPEVEPPRRAPARSIGPRATSSARPRVPTPRSKSGYVIEIDKTRQMLMVARNGSATYTFNVSTGSDHPVHERRRALHRAHSRRGVHGHPAGERTRPRTARHAVAPEVLHVDGDRGPWLHRRAAVPRVARLRAYLEHRDELDLGPQRHADRHDRVGLL